MILYINQRLRMMLNRSIHELVSNELEKKAKFILQHCDLNRYDVLQH